MESLDGLLFFKKEMYHVTSILDSRGQRREARRKQSRLVTYEGVGDAYEL